VKRKIAIFGGRGHLGEVLREIAGLPDCEIVANCTSGSPVELRHMLGEAKPDVLVVCSPLEDHAECVRVAVSGHCHCFCEKPIATTFEGLEKIAEAAAKAPGVKFAQMCAPFYDAGMYDAARRVGEIGAVRVLSAQKSYKLGIRDDWFRARATSSGIFPWVGIHAISWLWHFAGRGRFKRVAAAHSALHNRGNGDLEISAAAMFEFEGGVCATLTADYLRPENAALTHGDDRLRVAGTAGVIDVRDGVCRITGAGRDETFSNMPPRGMFEDFLRAVDGLESNAILNDDALHITHTALLAREVADGRAKSACDF